VKTFLDRFLAESASGRGHGATTPPPAPPARVASSAPPPGAQPPPATPPAPPFSISEGPYQAPAPPKGATLFCQDAAGRPCDARHAFMWCWSGAPRWFYTARHPVPAGHPVDGTRWSK
jgi:hypothetical protein